MNRSLLSRLWAVPFLLLAVACGDDYDHADISGVQASPLGGDFSVQHLTVPEGTIVKAHIVLKNDDDEKMQLAVDSKDTRILEVHGIVNDSDYAFLGMSVGHTQLVFKADDDVVLVVEADVTPQPAQ